MSYFHKLSILMLPYLDDFLIAGDCPTGFKITGNTGQNFLLLGLGGEWLKSPSKIFLGMLLNTRAQTSSLPTEKHQNFVTQISLLFLARSDSIRKIMSIVGLLTSTKLAIRWA